MIRDMERCDKCGGLKKGVHIVTRPIELSSGGIAGCDCEDELTSCTCHVVSPNVTVTIACPIHGNVKPCMDKDKYICNGCSPDGEGINEAIAQLNTNKKRKGKEEHG